MLTPVENDIKEAINYHIEKCTALRDKHIKFSRNSNHWQIILNLCGIGLSASLTMIMTLVAILDHENVLFPTVVGSTFGFLLTIIQKVNSSYNFEKLQILHENISDNFHISKYKFIKLLNEYNEGTFDKKNYDVALEHFISLNSHHIQPVSSCNLMCCYS